MRRPALVAAAEHRGLEIGQPLTFPIDACREDDALLQARELVPFAAAPAERVSDESGQKRAAGEVRNNAPGVDRLAAEGQ